MALTLPDVAHVRRPARYERILQRSEAIGFGMNSDVLTGSLLRTLAASKPGGRLLELGTGAGLGTCWLLEGMDAGASLVSVDNDPTAQAIARDELGADPRLDLRLIDGADFLSSCRDRFDLVYADTWPGKYTHLQEALACIAPGGLFIVDDMLPQSNWPTGHDLKAEALSQVLATLDGFHVTTLAWSTGLFLCTRCRS